MITAKIYTYQNLSTLSIPITQDMVGRLCYIIVHNTTNEADYTNISISNCRIHNNERLAIFDGVYDGADFVWMPTEPINLVNTDVLNIHTNTLNDLIVIME
jgi:hypothetical protein